MLSSWIVYFALLQTEFDHFLLLEFDFTVTLNTLTTFLLEILFALVRLNCIRKISFFFLRVKSDEKLYFWLLFSPNKSVVLINSKLYSTIFLFGIIPLFIYIRVPKTCNGLFNFNFFICCLLRRPTMCSFAPFLSLF